MPFPRKLLADGEEIAVSTRTHIKELLMPVLILIVVSGLAGFLAAMVPADMDWMVWAIAGLAAVLIFVGSLWPFLTWLGATYTVTNRRLITRRGVLTRVGHDIPLRRINDVAYEKGLVDRILGCGTLVISAASEGGQITLPDVPHVEELHLTVTNLLSHGAGARSDDDTFTDEQAPEGP